MSMLFWWVHSVRSRTKPELTDSMQFLVSTPMANSTASRGFWVASMMVGIDLLLVAVDRAVRLDHRGDGVAQEIVVLGDHRLGGAVGVEAVFGPEVRHHREHVGAGLLLLARCEVLRMQRDAVDLAGDEAGQPPGGALRDELRVVDGEPAGAQRGAADQPVEAADAAGGGEPLALEVGGRLDVGAHHVGLRRARREAPDLPRPEPLGDRGVGQVRDRRALADRGDRGAGGAAVELDDVGVDAALGEEAERLGDIGRRVHHVGRRHRDADVDLAHRAAAALGAERGRGGEPTPARKASGAAAWLSSGASAWAVLPVFWLASPASGRTVGCGRICARLQDVDLDMAIGHCPSFRGRPQGRNPESSFSRGTSC